MQVFQWTIRRFSQECGSYKSRTDQNGPTDQRVIKTRLDRVNCRVLGIQNIQNVIEIAVKL